MEKSKNSHQKIFLITCTLIVGLCSIIYELLISTTSSYFLGNSVKQFSVIIGIYMASMGVGSYISRWIIKSPIFYFTFIELLLGFIGAFSVPLCYMYFLHTNFEGFNFVSLLIIVLIGVLTGLEVPLLTRVMEKSDSLKNNISTVLTFDYIGGLIATLLFPFFLLPFVGLYTSSLVFGLINVIVGICTFFVFRHMFSKQQKNITLVFSAVAIVTILCGLLYAQAALKTWNDDVFVQDVIYQEDSEYQSIAITSNENEHRLYLNGAIQFSSRDEYRYHESLVHIPLSQIDRVKRVLVLGGGDGLAAREILKYTELERLDIVDLDPKVTVLAKNMELISNLNQGALEDSRTHVINEDAFVYLMKCTTSYDAIICDLPDPTSESLARLYSNAFYRLVRKNLAKAGVMVTQATSPELTKNAFWCIDETLKSSGFRYTFPYQVSVPSFGVWGFVMAKSTSELNHTFRADISTRFLENGIMRQLGFFPKDKRVAHIQPNNLDNPILLEYYLDHWHSLQGKKR